MDVVATTKDRVPAEGADEQARDGARRRAPRDGTRSYALYVGALVAIVAVATLIRVPPLTATLPYPSYVDEHFVLRPAANIIANRTFDPGVYNYPPALMYMTAAVSAVLHVLPGGGSVGAGSRATLEHPYNATILSTDLIVAGRLAVLFFSVGIVVVSALLATRLAGRRAGVVAAVLTATTPALVTRSAIVIVDTPASFFVATSMLFASYVQTSRSYLWTVLAGASAGLAAATKYQAGFVVLVGLTVIAMWDSQSLGTRLKLMAAALAACVTAAVVAAPTLFLRLPEVARELRNVADVYGSKVTTSYWHEAANGREVGIPILVVAAIGVLILLRSPKTRPMALGYLVFAVALALSLARYSFQPFRNMLPLVPFLAVAAAIAIVAIIDALGKLSGLKPALRAGLVVVGGLALSLAMISAAQQYYFDSRIDLVDSRVEVREYLARHVQRGDEVLVADELAFVPNEIARIPGSVTTESLAESLDAEAAAAYDYVVVGGYGTAEVWRPELQSRRKIAEVGHRATMTRPRSFRPPDQIIRVFGAPNTADPAECYPICG